MRYLVTGHTGFKGSWLILMLQKLGHEVSGIALDPLPESLYVTARVHDALQNDFRGDIRDASAVRDAVALSDPEVIVHLAAQPLVRDSYRDPRTTFETNVMGTLNVLQASQDHSSVRARIIITTDKVYRNVNRVLGYTEPEPLGGDDPYSASKAMADLLTHSWATSFGGPPTCVARAGNVIGGGDVSSERLLPDIIRALRTGLPPQLRYPEAVRPWQHVLDCLNGYLALIRYALARNGMDGCLGAWNFGPGDGCLVSVGDVTTRVMELWGADGSWGRADNPEFVEASQLSLDSRKAAVQLGWRNLLDLDTALAWTTDWYWRVSHGNDPRSTTDQQIKEYLRLLGK